MESPSLSNPHFDLVVVGGGPAGYMGAITAAEAGVKSVVILEASSSPLEKVRISGGGRCNVTHSCWEPKELVLNYPRGSVPLLGPFSNFACGDTVSWFRDRGVNLITESDGRMFPSSNNSEEIISSLINSANSAGVEFISNTKVFNITFLKDNNYLIHAKGGISIYAKSVLISTGSNPSGRKLAASLGHRIIPPVPSLFSFLLKSTNIIQCSGVAINDVFLKLICKTKSFSEKGRVLITHWGLSGPAILRLSSFAARDLFDSEYKARIEINWINKDFDQTISLFRDYRLNFPSKRLFTSKPFQEIPKKLWLLFLSMANINSKTQWANLKNSDMKSLIDILVKSTYRIDGKRPFRDEFVTAGGLMLNDVDFSTMESRKCKGLYFAGELLDVDGITGGFNFQHCWTTGWIAGLSASKK